jgi:8-oxo-dGTP diphosphatase
MEKKKQYVIGFAFNSDFSKVALIRKNKPVWQKGCLNGIGGKIEEGETPIDAQEREFKEEAGIEVNNWFAYALIRGSDFDLYVSKAVGVDLDSIRSMEDEQIEIHDVDDIILYKEKMIDNLPYLICMGKYDVTHCFYIEETTTWYDYDNIFKTK